MSRRFKHQAVCPDCGLTVQANQQGELKSHQRKAIEAGRSNAACVGDAPMRGLRGDWQHLGYIED